MKKLLTLVVIALCVTSIGFAKTFWVGETQDVSLRLEGLSPAFAGLVDDEFTDFWVNPVDILNVKGGRLYTNLSNYVRGDETQFGSASDNEYLIGGVYSWENIGTLGAFFRNRKLGADDNDWALPVIYGRQIDEALAFGAKVSYQKAEIGNNADLITLVPAIKYQVSPELAVAGLAKIGIYGADVDVDGTLWGLGVQAAYQLNDATKLRGYISYENAEIDNTINGGDTFAIGVGSASKLNEKLLLALGLVYGDADIDGTLAGYSLINNPTNESEITLPVGLEYTMTDWLAFRIGATHRIPENTSSTTDYSYGAGLNITENLTIDVTQWSNLTDLDAWRLSATVKF